MRIIYKTPENTVSVVSAAPKWRGSTGIAIKDLTDDQLPAAMEELAQKGCSNRTEILRLLKIHSYQVTATFRNAWEIAESELTDGVGA